MGDRCWAKLTIKASDAEKFKGLGHVDDELDDKRAHKVEGATIEIEWDELNYGGYDMMSEFTKKGLTCLLEHGAGYNYVPGYNMSFFGYKIEIALTSDGEFFVPIDFDGNISNGELEIVLDAVKLRKLILAYFNDEIQDYAAEFAKLKFTGENPFIKKEIA